MITSFSSPKRFIINLRSSLADEFGFPCYPVSSVSSLTLVGLDLLDLEDSDGRPIIDWAALRALNLKSCSQLELTLSFLQYAIIQKGRSGQDSNLKSFDLRSELEADTATVTDALTNFLTSFTGFVHLGVLLEDRDICASKLPIILENHRPTLRRLNWDVRLQARTLLATDVSRAQARNKNVYYVSKWCPLLEGLGLSLDWPALMDPPENSGTLAKVRQLPFHT